MARTKSSGDLEAYLREHLKYERDMLRHTYSRLTEMKGLDWCAMFESFGVHARNLYDFLRNEGSASSTFRAVDYIAGYKGTPHSEVDGRMNESFFHMSAKRLQGDAVNTADAETIGGWIDREWAVWAGQLGEPYRTLVDVTPACPPRTIRLASGSPGASSEVSFTSSSTSATIVHGSPRQG
jgi:hypothetical protein